MQKNAFRIILGNRYEDYEDSLNYLQLDKLSLRREKLSLKFALNGAENSKTRKLFKVREKIQKLRKQTKFKTIKANTERMRNSAVPYLGNLLNENLQKNKN